MEYAYARHPRGGDDQRDDTERALRAVPDGLTPAERRDWQSLAERRTRRERAERAAASRRDGSVRPVERTPRRAEARAAPADGVTAARDAPDATRSARYAPAVPRSRISRAPGNAVPARAAAETAPRRTIEVDSAAPPRRQPSSRRRRWRAAGIAAGPDRLALWAVVLCLFMALVAAATARGQETGRADATHDGKPSAGAVSPQDRQPAASARRGA